ncbi:MAG: S8 family serine peptidase [Lachnospiraceae bacterium]|nr:S8 family serine peptidase [Lachnospiraceae bacterium]
MDPFYVSPALREDYSDIIIRTSSQAGFPETDTLNSFHTKLSGDYPTVLSQTLPQNAAQTPSGAAAGPPDPYPSQQVNQQYSILYAPLIDRLSTVEEIGYPAVPKLFTETNVVSLEAAGILPVRIRPSLDLSGAGVLIGILDSGIDYTHPAFRNADGTTRILRLWDQADERGTPPDGISYGTEYTESEINRALFFGNPAISEPPTGSREDLSVPLRNDSQRIDSAMHGTAVAGIACGGADAGEGFTGVAPESRLAFVCLKPAKQYLRDYFRIPDSAAAYQEDDLMVGVRYLQDCAAQLHMPLVICLPLGSSQGGHTGHTPLENLLEAALYEPGTCVVTGTGNELGLDHHFQGMLRHEKDFTDVELLIEHETAGFSVELWADAPDLYSLGFTSPLGETISPVPPFAGTSREFSFLLENSRISLTWAAEDAPDASQVALIRFADPTPGIWRIRVSSFGYEKGSFHLWLPADGLVDPQIRFLASNADTTLVIPSCAPSAISVGTWNAYDGSLYLHSGRGYTRSGLVKPDFVSPGVRVTCPAPGGAYASLTGSSAAAALACGAAALLLEYGQKQEPPQLYSLAEIKELFLSGVLDGPSRSYPNQAWGWGMMNIYNIFEATAASKKA